MGIFFVYILKSSVCLVLFYLFYRLLFSRETFHRFNRIALLAVIMFSVAIPLFKIATDEPVAIQRPVQNMEYLLQMAQQTEVDAGSVDLSSWLKAVFILYVCGCTFFFIQMLYSIFYIFRLLRSGEKFMMTDGISLIVTPLPVSPFSWMNYIVISRIDREESGVEILTHERAHIAACHSIDMLIIGFCVALHWFNPAVWLLKQELQNIHEYEADESVISHGVDSKKYQLLLIKKAVGSQRFTSMANSFNHSKLKKRILMMVKRKSSPWARLKCLYVLPLTALAVVTFARPEISRELEKVSNVKVIEAEVLSQVKTVEKKISTGKTEKVEKAEKQKKKVSVRKKEAKVSDIPVTNNQVNPQTLGNQVKVIGYGAMDMGESTEKDINFNIPGNNSFEENKGKLLYILDGQDTDYARIMNLDKNQISTVSVLKSPKSIDVYGERGQFGTMIITTNMYNKSRRLSIKQSSMSPFTINHASVSKPPLILIDGKKVPNEAMEDLDPNTIKSISVLKDEASIERYGEEGKNGIIEIELKK